MKKVHYANLNFVRCFAAFMVIIHHTEQLKSIHGYPNLWNYQPILLIGKLGVDLFFVLSGFLITSLLFVENEMPQKISIKKFLMRRVLRIWPLYFLIVTIGFFIAPNVPMLQLGSPFISPKPHFLPNLLLYVLFLPQIQVFLIGPILYCAQAWSIGIEECFYVFWPFVVKKFAIEKLVYFIAAFILIYLTGCFVVIHFAHYNYNNELLQNIKICSVDGLKFDCLLIGGAFAIIHYKLKDKRSFITSKLFQVLILISEAALVISGNWFGGFYWEIHAILYGFIILNLTRLDTSLINMEYSAFDFFGKISYGMYMYHFLIINIAMKLVYKLNAPILLYPLAFGGVILISTLSYKYFEGFFLKKKLVYSNIITG